MKRTLAPLLALALLLSLVLLGGCGGNSQSAQADSSVAADLKVYCFQAGAADAFFLWTDSSAVLIDAGEKGFGKEILAFLEEQGITKLDYLIITHFDQDHVGGAAKVLNNFEVGAVLQSNQPKDSEEYEKYCKALANTGIEAVTVTETYAFTLDGVAFSVDPPRQSDYNSDDSNNSSLIVSVTNGRDSLLFAGDAQTERLAEFLSSNSTAFDFLKVPHHGRAEPLMEDLIASVSPGWAVITSSDEEPEDETVLGLLESAGAEVFLTRQAPVMIESSGDGLRVEYVQG